MLLPYPSRKTLQSYSPITPKQKHVKFFCEKSLKQDELKRAVYKTAIEDYVECGFARELTEKELKAIKDKPRYYAPHHPVFKESSSLTKVEIIFDANAKDPNSNSLNNWLLKGPNLLLDIAAVLLKLRMHKFALNGYLCQILIISNISYISGEIVIQIFKQRFMQCKD